MVYRFTGWVELWIPSESSSNLEILATFPFLWIKLNNVRLVPDFCEHSLRLFCIVNMPYRARLINTVGRLLSLHGSLVSLPDRSQRVLFYDSVEEFLLGDEPVVQLLLLDQLVDGAILPLRVRVTN